MYVLIRLDTTIMLEGDRHDDKINKLHFNGPLHNVDVYQFSWHFIEDIMAIKICQFVTCATCRMWATY